MSTLTPGDLKLVKPDNGDFVDGWDVPENANKEVIDTSVSYAMRSINNASGSLTNTVATDIPAGVIGSADALQKRMDLMSDADGTLKPQPEITLANFSRLTGESQGVFELFTRLEQYIYWASQGQVDTGTSQRDRLQKELARRGLTKRNSIITTGDTVSVAAAIPTFSPSSIAEFNIDGKIYNIRKATGSSTGAMAGKQTAFLYVEPGGATETDLYTGVDGVMAKSGAPVGAWNTLTSATVGAFTDAKVGDIVRIAANTSYTPFDIGGDYIVEAVGAADVRIIGGLPISAAYASSVVGLNFTIINPFAAKLSHQSVTVVGTEYFEVCPDPAASSGRAYIGEVQWNGAATVITPFAYRANGEYNSGWTAAPAIAGTNPASVAATNHMVGVGFMPTHVGGDKAATPMKTRVFTARKNAVGHIYDVQELPFEQRLGGTTVAPAGVSGWFGYVTRQSIEIVYGAKLPVAGGYAYQRKAQGTTFPNDHNIDASYEAVQANSVYRIVVERDA